MNVPSIRVRASAVFLDGGRILVHVVENKSDGKTWHITPGGGLDFGEHSREAVRREIKEELGWSLEELSFVDSFESFHEINGIREHEISFVYQCVVPDHANPNFQSLEIKEDNGKRKTLKWIDLDTLNKPRMLLYPNGLLPTLKKK